MFFKKILIFILLMIGATSGFAVEFAVLPQPQEMKMTEKTKKFKLLKVKNSFNTVNVNIALPKMKFGVEKGALVFEINQVDKIEGAFEYSKDEAYELIITSDKIVLNAVSPRAAFWGLQTLRQLITIEKKYYTIPIGKIIDFPAFPFRGWMQDVGRSFIPIEELKREIDIMARYKINVFHWHLTENLGWRLESKKYPQLNDKSTFERMPGKYYTLADAKELVQYCKDRHIILLPEIDMPGHSAAFKKAFKTDMQSVEGMKILKDLLTEAITEGFADHETVPYFHIGTDEVQIHNPAFVPEMVAYVRHLGKKVVSWNPGAKYQQGEIDMIQMWSSRGRPIIKGVPTLDCRFHYINHFDSFADLAVLYFGQVYAQPIATDTIAGVVLAVWHDRYVEKLNDILASNGIYPHLLTMAEATWKGQRKMSALKRGAKLPNDGEELKEFADFERRLMVQRQELKKTYQNLPFIYTPQSGIHWRITEAFPNKGDFKKVFPPENNLQTTYIYEDKSYNTFLATGATIYLRHTWGNWICGHYSQLKTQHTAYAYTYIYSPKDQAVGLWVNTQNYGRSEADVPPPQGQWDYYHSKFWLNDQEIQPPVWENTHKGKNNEISLRNENFEVRPPIAAKLNKGWNKVLIKLPMGNFSRSEVRLVKWMFTFAVVTPEGEPLKGLIYSPDKQK